MSHAIFEPSLDRPDPITLLQSQAQTRVPELVPIRYERMAESPFAFYRGAALIMASDLARTAQSGLYAQICGDAHLANFGAFGTPERRLIFDINDFDETNPGPWEWDLKRLVTSFEVAGREREFSKSKRRSIIEACSQQYRTSIQEFAQMRQLDIWYASLDADVVMKAVKGQADATERKRAKKNLNKTRNRDSMQAMHKLTEVVDGKRRIISDPPLITNVRDLMSNAEDEQRLRDAIATIIHNYQQTLPSDRQHLLEQFTYTDLARKVVGVGSVGTRCFVAMFIGRDEEDPLFLQVKQAERSVIEQFTAPSQYRNHGERVVAGQRLMQSASDIFLGWDRVLGADGQQRDFYLRQLRDWKGSAAVDEMSPELMSSYAQLCAWTLAKAHARSGDAIAIAAYVGRNNELDEAMTAFARAYADQNERDHRSLVDAIANNRVVSATS